MSVSLNIREDEINGRFESNKKPKSQRQQQRTKQLFKKKPIARKKRKIYTRGNIIKEKMPVTKQSKYIFRLRNTRVYSIFMYNNGWQPVRNK